MPFGGPNGSQPPETISLTVKSRGEFDMTTVSSVEIDTTYPRVRPTLRQVRGAPRRPRRPLRRHHGTDR